MTANSASNHPTISQWLAATTELLKDAGIASARLDAELIACHELNLSKVELIISSDNLLTDDQLLRLETSAKERASRVPLAYITNQREFYGRTFCVNEHTLIPRPESETIVETCLSVIDSHRIKTVLDVGCGSGCLGISLTLERSAVDVLMADISQDALEVARKNLSQLRASAQCIQSNLLENIEQSIDLIVANLPYVPNTMSLEPELAHEPKLALFAEEDGLALIYKLIEQARDKQPSGGFLILESHTAQIDRIATAAIKNGYSEISRQPFCSVFQKI